MQTVSLVCQDVNAVFVQWLGILRRFTPQNDRRRAPSCHSERSEESRAFRPLSAQVYPLRVFRFYQGNLSVPLPSLYLLLSSYGRPNVCGGLVVHQPAQVIPACKARGQLVLVLVHPSLEVAGYTDVQPVNLACQDVYAVFAQWLGILRRFTPQNDMRPRAPLSF